MAVNLAARAAYARRYGRDNRARLSRYMREYRGKHRLQLVEYDRRRSQALKLGVLEAYGGPKCRCCGETRVQFLTLDHIKNDGATERRGLFGRREAGGKTFYQWLTRNKFPGADRLQVLCMNCNFAKGHYNICPHATERKAPHAV